MNSYDIDGCIFINKDIQGIYPGPKDVIITGRSYEEKEETLDMLHKRGIKNEVYFNHLKYEEKTRESSGLHKANIIKQLKKEGFELLAHFEDDKIQARIIKTICPDVQIIMISHDLTHKENQRNLDY